MLPRRSRAFCKALYQEIGDDPKRWTTITAVADRLGIDQDKAEALAAELDEQGLVRVGGGHSVTLAPEGWQLVRKQARQRRQRV
jgi:Mn-dependent DtxR family transcriptional regulator